MYINARAHAKRIITSNQTTRFSVSDSRFVLDAINQHQIQKTKALCHQEKK